ncbi:MAG: hypothetical protein H6673_16115 [Anaerolineales bacterium]|nr:hypothetical protein [Anaerolineales bacterium]
MGKRLLQVTSLGLLCFLLALSSQLPVSVAQDDALLLQAWETKDMAALSNDNTGATFALSDTMTSAAGTPALEVIPSGTAEETKVAWTVSGADIQDLMTYTNIELEVYLLEENAVNANKFFMGMADVGGDWAWVGGIFSETEAQAGWNRIVYTPDATMNQPKADATYTFYLSFFNANDEGAKTPLTEPFYLGSVYLTGMAVPEPSGDMLVEAWEAKDVAALSNDNTGATFALSDMMTNDAGAAALEVTPSGTSEETKVAWTVSGADIQGLSMYSQIALEVYLPEANAVNANKFFMGMADVGGDWAWVGGVFSETVAQAGWNRIVYTPDATMSQPKADATYTFYLSFFNANDEGAKTPLTEAFYLGSMYLGAESTPAPSGDMLVEAWEAKDVAALSNDNTGATFALSEMMTNEAGVAALEVTPSGTSEETKVAWTVSGADIQGLLMYSQIALEVYLPEANAVNANKFFMGMADVGGEWAWVGGVFSETVAQAGWNRIVYTPDATMSQPKADATYTFYLSFFNADDAGTKTPLTEPFYLGSMYLSSAADAGEAVDGDDTAMPDLPETMLFDAWEGKDVAIVEPDNTGSTFAVSNDVLSPAGNPTMQVTPSGVNEETKLAWPVSGADLQPILYYSQIQLELYLPEENALNSNKFFMGMSDVTGEWTWVGGIWSDAIEVQSGWNTVVFTLDSLMRNPKADGSYYIYLAFMNADENENKTVLTEAFYLGSMTFAGLEGSSTPAPADAPLEESIAWDVWNNKDFAGLTNDNSGSTLAVSEDVQSPNGTSTIQVTPDGIALETKVAIPFSGEALQNLLDYQQIELNVYLPEGNAMNPNRFFMGMGDVTGDWAWVGGIFSTTEEQPGWNRLVYAPDNAMRNPKPDGSYVMYLSFFYEDLEGKQPLTEPFYLGDGYLSAPVVDTAGSYTLEGVYQSEADLLLTFDDVALLDAIAHETFDYFWYEANPANGLIKDRSTPDSPASIAAVGFGLTAITIGIDRGWITYDQGYERAMTTINSFLDGYVPGQNGFYFHFISMETGERVWSSEVSSIDTTLLLAGAIVVHEYFKGTELGDKAAQLYQQADWAWMMSNDNMVVMGWKPDIGFLSQAWDHFDESVLLYPLAIGSPTHPVPADTWDRYDRPVNTQGEFIYLGAEPLFVYQYPLAYMNLHNMEDAYANYFNNTTRACQRNQQFAVDNADIFATYQNGVWGISASDGPRGYKAYGATGGNHDGTIAPYASISCLPFTPEAALESARAMLAQYGSRVWREYGFVSAINAKDNWYSVEHIGIDQGDILLMVTNYQDNFVWNLFMQNEWVQNGLNQMGFVPSEGDYAVTPAYLEQVRSGN